MCYSTYSTSNAVYICSLSELDKSYNRAFDLVCSGGNDTVAIVDHVITAVFNNKDKVNPCCIILTL